MDKEEFFFLIPGVLYGIALFDLLSIFRSKKLYWETVAWALMLFVSMVGILFDLYPKLGPISDSFWVYLLFLFSPILFVHSCYTIAPQKAELDQEEHFLQSRQSFFTALTAFISVNILVQYLVLNDGVIWIRAIALIFFVPNIFIDNKKLRIASALGLALALGFRLVAQHG